MDLSDEDLFPISDEDPSTDISLLRNPVEEHLLKQMHDATDRVEKARANVDCVREVTEKILKKLQLHETCGASSQSDTESDSYEATGEPVLKKRCLRKKKRSGYLKVENTWQRIVDDKWIIGVVIKNEAARTFVNPRLHVIVKDQTEVRGISSFWKIVDSLSTKTDELVPEVDKIVATAVLDLPDFSEKKSFEARATISYILDKKHLQTPLPIFRLRADDVINRNFAPKFSPDMESTVIAIKSISVDREILIPVVEEGARLFEFLEENGFKNPCEEMPDVYVAKNNEFCRHCIVEFLPITETGAPIRVSARTPSHLEVIIRLLSDKFPDVEATDMEKRLMEAARALERELELELAGDDPGSLHMARIITDLLVP